MVAMDNKEETPVDNDTVIPTTGLEIMLNDEWIPSDSATWNAWTGLRAMWGKEYHGPVFLFNTQNPWTGRRLCPCHTCQEGVEAIHRPN